MQMLWKQVNCGALGDTSGITPSLRTLCARGERHPGDGEMPWQVLNPMLESCGISLADLQASRRGVSGGVPEALEVMDDNMSDFIRHLRRQLGMTQEEFAHSLGITVGTVNRWENGRFRPSKLARATILEFARRHGVTVQTDQVEQAEMSADGDKPIH